MADRLANLLRLTADDIAAYENSLRRCCGRRNGDPLEERRCSEDQCVELWCPCGAFDGAGYGPVGCACKEKSPWKETDRG